MGHLIASLGDSREDPAILSGLQKGGGSQLNWACALAHQRYRVVLDQGQSGKRTDEYLSDAAIAAIIASNVGTVHIMGAMNNIGQDYPSPTTSGAVAAADVMTACAKFRAAGINVVLEAETGQNGMTAARYGQCLDYTNRLRDYQLRTPGIYWHDARPVVHNMAATSLANLFKTGMEYDGTHLSQRGAYYWGKSLKAVLDSFIPASTSPTVNSAFELPANGRFQLLDNPLFLTTSGGSTSTGVTGTLPGSCTVNKTGAGTSVAVTSAAQSIDMSITFGAQGDNARLSMAANNANWLAGDWLLGACRVSVTNPSGLAGPQFTFVSTGDSVGTVVSDLSATTTWAGPDESFSITMLTLPFQVPAYTVKSSLVPTVYFHANAAGSQFNAKAEQMGIFRIPGGY